MRLWCLCLWLLGTRTWLVFSMDALWRPFLRYFVGEELCSYGAGWVGFLDDLYGLGAYGLDGVVESGWEVSRLVSV